MLRISARSSRELQALLLTIRTAEKDVQAEIRKHTKAIGQPEWQQAVREEATTKLETRVLGNTARLSVSNQNIRLSAAGVGRPLRGGLRPPQDYAGVEFGAAPRVRTVRMTSRRGRAYSARRNVHAQLRPRNRKGYAFYPAVAGMVPRIFALWAQTAVRTVMERWGVTRG